ncbi:MAG: sugar phosphate isomerase/epimerase [Deltaproteobacteria bacterium]|nr:sugar phosphate isomerase/epimerase [Deltaproteobacteria bacterium]
MRFGAMNFPVHPVVDEIRAIAALGFDYLELTLDAPLAHHTEVRRQRSEILGALVDGGLGLVCHLPTFIYTADLTPALRQASRDEIRRSLDVAADLGAEKVVAHPPAISFMGARAMDRVRPLVEEGMAEMLAHAASLGVCVCLENMFPRYRVGVEPSAFEPLLAAWPELRLTLDVGHAFIEDRKAQRLLAFIETLGHRVGHLHLSDNRGQRDEHLPLGKGRIPYARIARALTHHVTMETITLEIFTDRREDLVDSREFFRRLLASG